MVLTNLEIDVLRSFVAGHDLGSFARAADRLGRSTSAVSAQLKKLEDQLGVPVLRKSGRGLVLTAQGEIALSYARRLLEINDAAVMAIRGTQLAGRIRIGIQEDFGEGVLTSVLGAFARTHPSVIVDVRVARNAELEQLYLKSAIDIALTWQSDCELAGQEKLTELPIEWIGDLELVAEKLNAKEALPLVMFEAPCLMRSRAIDALDELGIPWRIAFTSSSLSGIWAAVRAGLGVTVRTQAGKPQGLSIISVLPALSTVGLCLSSTKLQSNEIHQGLAQVIRDSIAETLLMA